MRIAVEQDGPHSAGGTTPPLRLKLDLVSNNRPGIIHIISSQLARRGVSIEKLQTEVISGAWSGEQMFQMTARMLVLVLVLADLDTNELRSGLESLANELMVDITIESGTQL